MRQKPPSGASAQAKKKYYLAEYLDFLTPFTKSRQQKGSIPSPINTNEETSSSIHREVPETEPSEFELQHENSENNDVVEESATNESLLAPKTLTKVSTTKRKQVDPLEKCAIDYFTSKKRCQLETTDDADLLFLKSLLPDLRQMTNAQKHEFKWKTIQNIGEILYRSPPNNLFPTNTQDMHYTSSNSSFRPDSVLSNNSQQSQPRYMYSSSHISTPLASPSTNDYDFLQTM